jgi:hypothetical protein
MRRRLIVVWGLLAVLIGAIVAIELHDRAAAPSPGSRPARDQRLLLPVSIDEIGAIEIAYGGAVHRFERDSGGAWFYHGAHIQAQPGHVHQADPVMAERIAKALGGFDRARIERQFPPEKGLEAYGVAKPQMIVLVYRTKDPQPLAQYAVGDIAPDTFSRDVMIIGTPVISTIANYQIDNLTGLILAASGPPAQVQAPKKSP